MPSNEPTQLTVLKQSASTTNKHVNFNVTVVRPDLSPVVTGSVKLVFDSLTAPSIRPIQTVLRATSGAWTLAVKGVPAGTYSGKILFTDASQTHAKSWQPVAFTVTQGATPSPTPSPTQTAKPTPKPSVDGCKNQIKN
jgi:hypothetical protein